jgi:hypothetical protein
MGVRQQIIINEMKKTLERLAPGSTAGIADGSSQRVTLRESAGGGLSVRESQEQQAIRLKEERRDAKDQRRIVRETFRASGMDKKSAKKAARLLESDAYQARYRGL